MLNHLFSSRSKISSRSKFSSSSPHLSATAMTAVSGMLHWHWAKTNSRSTILTCVGVFTSHFGCGLAPIVRSCYTLMKWCITWQQCSHLTVDASLQQCTSKPGILFCRCPLAWAQVQRQPSGNTLRVPGSPKQPTSSCLPSWCPFSK